MKKSILIFVSIFICIHLFAHPKFIQPIDQNYIPRPTERADSLHGFDVQKYTLTLTINDAAHTIQGNVLANVTATDNINYIEYNLIGLNVNQVKVNDTISSFTYSNGLIHIPLNGITNGSQFTTQVDYSGIPALSGAPYNIGLIFSSTMVFTLSDPDASRYWWPCYDHPWDKAVVDLNVTMRSDWLVACNGIRTSMVDNGDGTKTHHWVGSNPMLPYLVCITASNYREINQTFGNIPIQNFVSNSLYNNAVTDFSDLPNMMSVYSQKYGPYPFEKYGNAVVNMQTFGAMEHQTMTTMGSDYIHGNHNGQWTIAHELSHQWFGNCVSPLTFKDVWLSEGFATYSEAVWEESQRGFTSMCNYIQSSFHNYYLSWEPASSPQTIYDPAFSAYFNPPSYEKAASVLHMLRLQVGDSTFWNIMQSWFQAHHNGNATTQEFEALCESISGQDLHQFFHQWIYGAGIPEIKFSYFYKTDLTNHEFHLKVFAKTSCASGEDFYVKLPIQVIHPNHSDSLLVDATPEISAPIDHVIPFTANDSIILNEDPHHWLLQRGLSPVYTAQPHALAANSSVYLSWVPYWSDVPVTSYLIYRTDESTIPLLISQVPANTLHYLDTAVTNGVTYSYQIKAGIDDDFTSDYSMETYATPTAFSMNQGLLVIDETRDGTGSAISPTDAMVDGFYDSVLSSVNHEDYDCSTSGTPTLALLGQYSTVLYHDDDFSTHSIQEVTDILGGYVIGGGNLIISGWKTASQIPSSFLDIFVPGLQVNYDGSPELVSVLSDIYPDLELDPAKLSSAWNGHLSMVDTFTNITNPVFTGNFIDGSSFQGQAMGIHVQQNGEFILLGFPLYVMQEEGVREFLNELLQQIDPVVSNHDTAQPSFKMSLSIHPNPFRLNANIFYTTSKSGKTKIEIYNIKGQLVRTLTNDIVKEGSHSLVWNGENNTGNPVSSGVYFCRMQSGNETTSRKLMFIK